MLSRAKPSGLATGHWFSPSKTGKPITPTPPVVTVVTRVVHKPKEAPPPTKPTPEPQASCSSAKKRKTVANAETNVQLETKRPRVAPPKARARPRPPPRRTSKLSVPHLEAVYRQSRSRSTSTFESPSATPIERKCWTDHDGSVDETFVSSASVVRRLIHSYKAFFRNLNDPDDNSFEPDPDNYPTVELEYPNDRASERFALLEPKDKDHYNPVFCLVESLHTIIEAYLTPPQRSLFGTLPTQSLLNPAAPVYDSPPNSTCSSSSTLSSLTSLSSPSSDERPDADPVQTRPTSGGLYPTTPSNDLLRSLSRAIHMRNGPLFLNTMARINHLLRLIKHPPPTADNADAPTPPNPLRAVPQSWSTTGIPKKVIMRIIEENYQRCVGPNVVSLKRYNPFSSEVYGELMPTFSADLIATTNISPDSLFLDLGSGVGNVLLIASLLTGCRSVGIEIMQTPARIAREQLKQFKMRCRMWGVEAGEVELLEGDMLDNTRVNELLPKADVVLVNNYVFREELNAALRPKFLDLKEGATVVSLKPFAPVTGQRLNERNIDDISAIFEVTTRPYLTGTVSWSNGCGQYYIHRVDREGYNDCREQYQRSRSAKTRRTRRPNLNSNSNSNSEP